jgi:uncharacterized membrane protein
MPLTPTEPVTSGVPAHVVETLDAIAELHKRSEREVPRHQRSIEAWAAILGRSWTVFVIVGVVVMWLALNTLLPRVGLSPPDPPPFSGLQVASSVGALVMATMVWATQQRQRRPVEERERLELQISMLAEQKLTKVIALVEELRRDMPNVKNRVDPLAEAMTHAVDPHAVADALKRSLEEDQSPATEGERPKPAESSQVIEPKR